MSPLGREVAAGVEAPVRTGIEVVVFRVGSRRFAVPRSQVRAIRPSPRVRARIERPGGGGSELPLVSLSSVLGLDRDTSVDRRVLEVEHWGRRLALEVTAIEGIRTARPRELHPLPDLVRRNCASANVLGLVDVELPTPVAGQKDSDGVGAGPPAASLPAVALDLSALLVEQGVELPDEDSVG